MPRFTRRALVLAAAGLWLGGCGPAAGKSPAELGFSEPFLAGHRSDLETLATEGRIAGAVTLLARHGEIAAHDAVGVRDLKKDAPMKTDAIFRIASMTKPVTAVALMILYDEGKWTLEDPVTKFIPEFASLTVLENGARVPLKRPMTMRHLMTHTAGLAYGLDDETPVDALYQHRRVLSRTRTNQQLIGELAQLPLAFQPGERWWYSAAVDVQGAIVERLSGQTLDDFLRARLFAPLKMDDTDFAVPKSKLGRVATLYTYDDAGALRPAKGIGFLHGPPTERPAFLSGGAGLFSTASDYFRFAQMLLNDGELDGVRILKSQTALLMRADQMPAGVPYIEGYDARPGQTFGLGVAVVTDPTAAGLPVGAGTFYWPGAYGTYFWVDPKNDIVAIGLTQLRDRGGRRPALEGLTLQRVYSALKAAPARRK